MDLAGLGTLQLHKIPVDDRHRMNVHVLSEAIQRDQQAGLHPFCVVATSGTVDVGAIDELNAIAEVAQRHQLWFHVDGACGALGMFSSEIAKLLSGIDRADSIALDFHKWGQAPYDAGFLLVRDGQTHHDTFAAPAAYLRRESRAVWQPVHPGLVTSDPISLVVSRRSKYGSPCKCTVPSDSGR